MHSRLRLLGALAALLLCSPCHAEEDPATPVREVMRLELWRIAAPSGSTSAEGPFAPAALERLYSKSFAALYAAARAKVSGADAPFDRDPILDGQAPCPLKDVTLTVLSPGAFHARARVEFKSAWCIDPGQDAAQRDRVTTTMFELANEDDEWRIDDIRRDDFSFRDLLTAAAPDAGQTPPPATPPADPKTCIKEESGFKQRGKAASFEIALTNICAQRMRCAVEAYITTSGGPTKGNGVLILERKSKGAAATRTYAIKLKRAGGMASTSRDCKSI